MNINTNVQELTRKLVWGLAGLSVASCLIRNDYNVLFAFLILTLINKYFVENTKFYTKLIVHILCILIIADILWLIIIMPYWNSDIKNDYWKRLSGMHTFVLILAFLQLMLKVGITGILVLDYKHKNPDDFMELTKLSYNFGQSSRNPMMTQVSGNINIESGNRNLAPSSN